MEWISPQLLIVAATLWVVWQLLKRAKRARRIDASKKAVLVTGCDSGFGRLLVERLAKKCGRVYAGCLTQKGKEELQALGLPALHPILLDVADNASVERMGEEIEAGGMGLWGVVNNAGIYKGSLFDVTSVREMELVTNVNFLGVFRVSKACIPFIRKEKGRIVNNISYTGYMAAPAVAAYTCSKHASDVLTRVMRWELQSLWGVRVVGVYPGTHKTPMQQTIGDDWQLAEAQRSSPKEFALYGEKYLRGLFAFMAKSSRMGSRDPMNVVEALEEGLLSELPCDRYIVGVDAWFWRGFNAVVPYALQDLWFKMPFYTVFGKPPSAQ
eukprot:Hpha_TRINITY_DN10864_c0_g4::TRINITY_DN10864_c0_g4_i2::g.23047::m.23047